MKRNHLGQALLLTMLLGLVGCGEDLTVETPNGQKEFRYGNPVTLRAGAKDQDDINKAPLVWYSSRDGRLGEGPEITVPELSPGRHEITIKQDGKVNSKDKDNEITILNDAPKLTISSPGPSAVVAVGQAVTFAGSATDTEDGAIDPSALVWKSDKDGVIGNGATFERTNLSPGPHRITVSAKDRAGETGSASVRVEIKNEKPQAVISEPSASLKIGVGTSLTFKGHGIDPDPVRGSARITREVHWRSDRDGDLGSGTTLTVDDLSGGKHTITLTVKDEYGAAGSEKVYVEVENAAPTVEITTPGQNEEFSVADTVNLQARVNDPDGFAIEDNDVIWRSNRDGRIGRGPTISADLSGGRHRITVSVTDAHGASATSQVELRVVNRPPTVEITGPGDGQYFSVADTVRFTARASDPDGFPIKEIEWRSDRDGRLGYESTLETDALSVGQHEITCTVTDKHGASESAKIRLLLVNEKPTATISSPDDASSFNGGEAIVFAGRGTDVEDGSIRDDLTWTVLREGETSRKDLGTGDRLTIRDLPFGTHRVFMSAKDSDGSVSDEASILVTITNRAPQATIAAPGNRTKVVEGTEITFAGSAFEPDTSSYLRGDKLTWKAIRVGGMARTLGTGREVKVDDLAPGTYRIVLIAADPADASLTDRATIRLTVEDAPAPTTGGVSTTGMGSAVSGGSSSAPVSSNP